MVPTVFQTVVVFLRSQMGIPAVLRLFAQHLRTLILAAIAAVAMTGAVVLSAAVGFLFAGPSILVLSLPLIIAAPILGAVLGGVMAFFSGSRTQHGPVTSTAARVHESQKSLAAAAPGEVLQSETARTA